MKKMGATVFVFAVQSLWLIALPARAQAETLKTADEVQKFTVRVMSAVGRGELEAAYTALQNYAVLPAGEIEAGLQATLKQRTSSTFTARYGKTVGHELIGKRELGASMLRFAYIEKTEHQPLPWTFHFYRGPGGWVLNEFGWDGSPAVLYLTN